MNNELGEVTIESSPVPPRSPFSEAVRRKVSQFERKEMLPASDPRENDVLRTVDVIDRMGMENFSLFHPTNHPDVSFPFTVIPVRKLVNELNNDKDTKSPEMTESKLQSATPLHRTKNIVIFPGLYYSTDLNPFNTWDMVYDDVIKSMSEVSNLKDVNVYIWGYPSGLWGEVSPTWVQELQANGLPQYGKALADFVRTIGVNDQSQFLFHGMSMGSVVAELTARELPELNTLPSAQKPIQLQLLLDNPAGQHEINSRKGLQIPPGFITEGVFRLLVDPIQRDAAAEGQRFVAQAIPYLKEKGILPHDEPNQLGLKKQAVLKDIECVIKGSPFDPKNIRAFIRQGIVDPTTFSPQRLKQTLEKIAQGKPLPVFKEGRSLNFPIGTSHTIDRLRIPRWSGHLKNALHTSVSST
ncbi:hypothetical protein A3C28_03410 [Candidatus Roizmanbacteria bacterium RIFCSPHIGHO2_02_FULL_39_9]|uniref:AB hydrolase-1 domain-containing protein n=1 Tax=Candidatus Roizmanbacteria bacterium RIFCSPHIGHO2_02_FULL_39_9 TaxID=1802040 RepID=A0A1F7H4N9_9BACT|nr:MAG: hypothetical protein A3C28_03410 [Candidatus Roizmanbacteria bacterium RIFCSPHIGHO2_02_FULL_39_9]